MQLHPKIVEAKRKALTLNKRSLGVNEFGKLVEVKSDFENRVVKGYLCLWGQRNLHGEKFIKGCFAKSIREHGPGSNAPYQIKFLNQHRQGEPLALFAVLREDEIGLYFETAPLDEVDYANRVLVSLRSGTLNNFSIGFDYIWEAGKIEWDDSDNSLVIIEGVLFEGSVVSIPSDMSTYAMRSVEEIEALDDDLHDFIDSLPRKNRLEARSLFARMKSLIDLEQPFEQRKRTLQGNEPANDGIDYNYLTKNLNLFK